MSIPAPDHAKLTDEEVWVDLHHGMIDSPMHRQVILTFQPNNLDRQTRASRGLVYAADKLVSATARFADFTGMRRGFWPVCRFSCSWPRHRKRTTTSEVSDDRCRLRPPAASEAEGGDHEGFGVREGEGCP